MSNDVKAELEEALSRFGLVLTDDPDFDHDEQTFEKAKASFVAALTTPAPSSEREAVLEEAARFVEQRIGDTFLLAEELRALKATPAPAEGDDLTDEQWNKVLENAPKPDGPLTPTAPASEREVVLEDSDIAWLWKVHADAQSKGLHADQRKIERILSRLKGEDR